MNPLAGRSAWFYSYNLQAEKDAIAIARTCRQFGITTAVGEVLYGTTWQGDIDLGNGGKPGQVAPRSMAEIRATRDIFHSFGMSYVVAAVPRGLIGQGEAELHAEAGSNADGLMVDLEVDSSTDYWPVSRIGLIGAYFGAVRATGGAGLALSLQPDSRIADKGREGEWNAIVLAAIAAAGDLTLAPQAYAHRGDGWPYGWDVDADERRVRTFAATGQPTCPTLYTAASTEEFSELARRLTDISIGFCAFRLGASGPAQLEAFAAVPIRAEPTPTPDPPAPIYTLDAIKLALVQKTLSEEWNALAHDAGQLAGVK